MRICQENVCISIGKFVPMDIFCFISEGRNQMRNEKNILKVMDEKAISDSAKVLYMRLSARRVDEKECAYVIYPINEIMQDMDCGTQKACEMLKQLEKVGYIYRTKEAHCVKIYIVDFDKRNSSGCGKDKPKKAETIENKGFSRVDFQNQNLLKDKDKDNYDRYDRYAHARKEIHQNRLSSSKKQQKFQVDFCKKINYCELLKSLDPDNAALLTKLVQVAVKSYEYRASTLTIGKKKVKKSALIKSLMKYTKKTMEYVIYCLNNVKGEIKNFVAYALTALYNAPKTIENFDERRAYWELYTDFQPQKTINATEKYGITGELTRNKIRLTSEMAHFSGQGEICTATTGYIRLQPC